MRVTIPNQFSGRREAAFDGIRGDTIVLGGVATHLGYVTRLDVHAGRRSHWLLGAVAGSALGGVSALVAGPAMDSFVCDVVVGWAESCDTPSPPYAEFIVGGALVGAGLGALIKTDRWEEVPLDRVRVGMAPPRRGGLALGLSVSF